jgi:hypothetical protein
MALTKNDMLLILGVIVAVVIYFMYVSKENATSVGKDAPNNSSDDTMSQSDNTESVGSQDSSLKSVILESDNTLPQSDSDKTLLKKMTSKNSAKSGEYKNVSYATGNRESNNSNLDQFFEQGDPLNSSENGNFGPNSDSDAQFAAYSGKPRKELSDEEKFNASAMLPKEERQDWFEDVTPQKIKNRHLINIYRPIGVNTVITSRKNGSLDLRGNPVNPKTFVSPFLNSSIEPDVNARGICT